MEILSDQMQKLGIKQKDEIIPIRKKILIL